MDTLGFRATRGITVGLGCLWSLLTLLPHKDLLLPSFAVYALFRTFTFNYYFAYLADRLGFRYFGVLAGASFFVAGVVGLLLQVRHWASELRRHTARGATNAGP
jgi:hypothetical protein